MRIRIGETIRAWARARSYRTGTAEPRGAEGSGAVAAGIPSCLPVGLCLIALVAVPTITRSRGAGSGPPPQDPFDLQIQQNANQMISDGRRIFRFDTFGDQAFWGGVLKLHEFVEGVTPGAANHPEQMLQHRLDESRRKEARQKELRQRRRAAAGMTLR